MRSSGRRSGGQYSRRRDEEYSRDEEDTNRGSGREQGADSLIADMAKGFVEAQAKIAGTPAGGANQEMLDMLEKISSQLAQLQTAPVGVSSSKGQVQGDQQPQQGNGQAKGGPQEELSAIFSRLLSESKSAGASQQGASAQQQGVSAQQQGVSAQQTGGAQSHGGQNVGRQQSGTQGAGGKSVTAQTAAQALAQAQYELANELEASLTKLKQVISESEKLADKISNLLGQENSSRQT